MKLGEKEIAWKKGLKLKDEVPIMRQFAELEKRVSQYVSAAILGTEQADTMEALDALWKDVAAQAIEGPVPGIGEVEFADIAQVGKSFFTRNLKVSG